MSGNKFEKQVLQKMEELQFTPSEAVWQNVEKSLRREKKRRRWLLIPLLLLCLSGAGYWILNGSGVADKKISHNKTNTAVPLDVNKIESPESPESAGLKTGKPVEIVTPKSSGQQNNVLSTQSAETNTSPVIGALTTNEKSNQKTTATGTKTHSASYAQASLSRVKDTGEKLKARNTRKQPAVPVGEEVGSFPEEISELLPAGMGKKPVGETSNAPNNKSAVINEDQELDDIAPFLVKKEAFVKKYLAIKPLKTAPAINIGSAATKQPLKKSKWHWWGNIGVGTSNLSESFAPFGALGLSQEEKSAANLSSTSGSLSARPPVRTEQERPGEPSPGFSVKLGLTAEKGIARRSTVSAGLSYVFYASKGAAGEVWAGSSAASGLSTNSNVLNDQQLYLKTANINYSNQYHFLQVPLSFNTRIGNNKQLPLFWSAGISANYLFASNALVYDNSNNTYFKNNRLFTPFQIGLNTGMAAQLFSKRQHPLRLGPELDINITRLLKEGSAQKRRFTYAGIKASLLLSKK